VHPDSVRFGKVLLIFYPVVLPHCGIRRAVGVLFFYNRCLNTEFAGINSLSEKEFLL